MGDHGTSCWRRRGMRLAIYGFIGITLICLLVVVPIAVVSSKSEAPAEDPKLGSILMSYGSSIEFTNELGQYGESVSLSNDGNYLAFGANEAGDGGKVFVKEWEGSRWAQMGFSIDGEPGENFGNVVLLSSDGKRLLVSGTGSETKGVDILVKGVVRSYVWSDNDNQWKQEGQVKSDEPGDRFGMSLSMSSDATSFIVGADEINQNNGYVKVYELKQGNWGVKGSNTYDFVGKDESRMGYAVAMSGDGSTICVGERAYKVFGNQFGKVQRYSFESTMDRWKPKGQELVGRYVGGLFGYSLSLNHKGDRVAIGDRKGGGNSEGSVTVYFFKDYKWHQLGEEQKSGNVGDQGGFKCELNAKGNVLAWSARGHDFEEGGVDNIGIVRVAQFRNGAWEELGAGIAGNAKGDRFGEAIALSGSGTMLAASSNMNSDKEYVSTFILT